MTEDPAPPDGSKEASEEFRRQVEAKQARKLRARGRQGGSVWFGLGMFGLIGWSVVIPALLGVALGVWIDRTWPSQFSWTLMLLLGGIILGSLNAWHWISQERKSIEKEKD